ncbi:low molecular weight protein-tyrosine-phosphatase [uncultured Aquitalea sp.]|uniref:low molecular weight protein-tyrosine-phosphatase n=1 Tax=uncultured Aquitalea sp. TaxID=540272 RepID=UPI0025E8BAA4|nr:low molecular weight protein-tyrosine-phosphatase [uncultured Aquitalea sp.]
MKNKDKFSVLMVCMGNICRSPTAEAVMRSQLQAAGLCDRVEVDSAGTHAYHVGEAPDPRSCAAARARGYDLSALRARQVVAADFSRFDLLLAADRDNMAQLRGICPENQSHKLDYILSPLKDPSRLEVPDPYYGGVAGFDRVLDLIELACDGWIASIKDRLA